MHPHTPSQSARAFVKHPLQRLPSPGRGASLALHLVSLASFARSFYFVHVVQDPLLHGAYGSHYQFLTILGLALATVTTALALLADLLLSPALFRVKNALAAVSAPLEVLISVLYWGLVLIDRNLVAPADVLPLTIKDDIGLHAAPTLFLLLDLLLFSPPLLLTAASALATSCLLATGYWFWVERCYQANGWYPYPIMAMLGTPLRVGLFGGAAGVMAACAVGLRWGYERANGRVGGV